MTGLRRRKNTECYSQAGKHLPLCWYCYGKPTSPSILKSIQFICENNITGDDGVMTRIIETQPVARQSYEHTDVRCGIENKWANDVTLRPQTSMFSKIKSVVM